MRSAFVLVLLGFVLAAGTAVAGPPGDQGVTVLRGSSAPPPPPPPAPPADDPTIIQREIVYAPYPVYALPGFIIPGVIVATHHHRPFPMTTTPLPNGWPLFQTLQGTSRPQGMRQR